MLLNEKNNFVRKLKKIYIISSLNLCIIMLFFIIIFFSFEKFDKNYDEIKTSKIFNKKTKKNNYVNEINIDDIAKKKEINLKNFYKVLKNIIIAKKIIAKIFLIHLILCFVKKIFKVKLKTFVFLIII